MSAGRFQRVDELFRHARPLADADRERYLRDACASDPTLRAEVESLLAHHDRPGPFLERPARAEGARPTEVDDGAGRRFGERIGSYTLISVLGEGGMGTVYLARQDQTRRDVAVKLMRGAAFSPTVRRRFEFEAQALGRLRHEGIAQVYEAGIHDTPGGPCPYIAMELVAGRPLHEHLRDRSPGVRERLELFARVCDAVHHAHVNGIIHRDLKPANIAVEETADGPRPKVLDFGIARSLGEDASATLRTETGQLVGTACYMSPEQAAGDPSAIDARSDVFALGVLLYEMLAGKPPHDPKELPMHEVLRRIQEEEPVALGTIDRALRGDLETVVRKAIEKSPQRRYQSAAELAADVRRHLANEPITASPPSALHQLRKLMRRHRDLTAAAALVVVVLLAGIIATSWQAIAASRARRDEEAARMRAERRFEDLRSLAKVFLFELDTRIEHLAGALPARQLIVTRGLEYLDSLASESDDDPVLRRELATGYIRLGDMQGGRWSANLGDTLGAAASYAKAARLLEAGANVGDAEALRLQFRALVGQADASSELNRASESLALYESARANARARLARDSRDADAHDDLSAALNKLAIAYRANGQPDGALDALADSDAALVRFIELRGESPAARRSLAVNRFHRAMTVANADPERALAELREYVEIVEALASADPDNVVFRRDAAVGHEWIGALCLQLGNVNEALEHLEIRRAAAERMVREAPGDATAHAGLSVACVRIGEVALERGDLAQARRCFDQALEAATTRATLDRGNAAAQREVGVGQYKLGELERARARGLLGAERAIAMDVARSRFMECEATFRQIEARGLLLPSDAGVFDDIREQISSCEGEPQRP